MLHAPNLTSPHGFTTRFGGVSQGVYAAPDGSGGFNMDGRAIGGGQDDPQHVAENRRRAVGALGFAPPDLALLWQIHGADVVEAQPDQTQTADAQVTDRPGRLLGILTADCLPILLEDAEAGVIGAAHAGWKGTLERVAERTVAAMQRLGARPERIRAAVGPGISAARYQVGVDVAGQFAAAGLGAHVREQQLDLAGANKQVLLDAGVPDAHVWLSGRCTFEPEFYSHRRDAGRTGRMLALIGVRA
ncbi:peptidoglycan editing factor PgeF [Deinococcus alpinitundrae]|uniref:peptidoglycan editing factor PgeF n=1 Tax=Deinococcus alpinitundrae TaxID=468913 RepID=UPI001ED93BFB|nr:peptidoglycan editing factor PgeF [Deinococcus alpinitundrae]